MAKKSTTGQSGSGGKKSESGTKADTSTESTSQKGKKSPSNASTGGPGKSGSKSTSQKGKKSPSNSSTGGAGKSGAKSTSQKGGQSGSPADAQELSVRPAPSTAEGLSDAQRKLIATIEDALPKLNEESLALIVRNCQVALYNDEMQRSREMILEAQSAVQQGRVPGSSASVGVDIEQVSDQSFVVLFGSERVFFTREELRQITKLCWGTDKAEEGARAIFRWMERERRDFLLDAGVDSPDNPGMQELWSLIRSRYKAR